MASFGTLWSALKLDISDFSSKLSNASKEVKKFGANLQGSVNGATDAVDQLTKATKKSGVEFKDVARIVQGIIISKIFYGGLQAIRNATDAVWEFSSSLEYAKIAYTNLFDDQELAEEFINVLKDFAATTPFSFSESEQASKRLLAYGVKYQNVMYMMQGVMAAASMQGDATKVENISRALGQIYTKGRLMNEEMRQLAEAGIPAYEILKEKLGLTQEQLQNLGNEAIPASVAINALVDGMSERFGDVVTASSKTMEGIISNIKDNASMVASSMFDPIFVQIKSVANALGTFLFKLREIQETLGTGGVFEYLVPEELQPTIRLLVANVLNLKQAVVNLVVALGGLLKPILTSVVALFNMFAPVVTLVIHLLGTAVSYITSNAEAMQTLAYYLTAAAAMWVVYRLKAVAAAIVTGIIVGMTKAVSFLSAALSVVAAHPIWALFVVLIGVVAGLTIGFGNLAEKVQSFFKSLTQINGYNPDDLLLPSQKDRANDLEKFNKRLDSTADSMDDLADSTGKATKAAKGLLSFDEVFKLNDPDEKTGNTADTTLDIDWSGLELDTEAYIPEVPDFTGFATDWWNSLTQALKDKLPAMGIGALLGGLVGGLLGGPQGALVGAAIGAFAGWFWDEFATQLGLTDVGKIAIPITTVIGGVIGGLMGGPGGAAIGAGIGLLVGTLIEGITKGLTEGDWSGLSYPIAMGIGAALGAIIGGPVGAGIGAAIGALIAWLIDTGFDNGEWNFELTASTIGLSLGGAIGMIVGGPAGALIGAAIGGLVGWIVGNILDAFQEAEWDWSIILGAFAMWGQDIGKAFLDGLFGDGGLFGWSSTLFESALDRFKTAMNATWEEGVGIFSAEIGGNIVLGILEGLLGALTFIFEPISRLFTAIFKAICAVFGIHSPATTMMPIGLNIILGIIEGFTGGIGSFITSISAFATRVISALSTAFTSISKAVTTWLGNLWSTVYGWFTDVISNITGLVSSIAGKISEGLSAAGGYVADKVSSAVSFFSGGKSVTGGHATGGIFNREHYAKFAEGNKAEAIIPLEEESAMQPFVDAVSNGLTASLAPLLASMSGTQQTQAQQLQPLYVGTLIADDRSLKELERKMNVIRLQESKRS